MAAEDELEPLGEGDAERGGEEDAGEDPAPDVEIVDEEEPPDETEPLLPSVNPNVGPETKSQRNARYAAMREAEERILAAMVEGNPDSPFALAARTELERTKRMEPVRAAYLKSKQKEKK